MRPLDCFIGIARPSNGLEDSYYLTSLFPPASSTAVTVRKKTALWAISLVTELQSPTVSASRATCLDSPGARPPGIA